MSAVLSRADRAPLGVASLETAGLATVDAKAAAFSTYLSYTGLYRVEGDRWTNAPILADAGIHPA